MQRGKLIVLSAPSGSGKTSIAKAILEKYPSMLFSVSATTRPRRHGEVEGKDYFFLTREDFERRIERGELVEWEEIYGNLYGTLKVEVDRALEHGRVMLFDIDVKGALAIKRIYSDDAVLIFIKAPSVEALFERLRNRKTEDEATLRTRMERVPMELEQGARFDEQVINERLDDAIADVERIINKHLKTAIVQQ
jgi:guanylate kinase